LSSTVGATVKRALALLLAIVTGVAVDVFASDEGVTVEIVAAAGPPSHTAGATTARTTIATPATRPAPGIIGSP
jgi:hypothetical protein